MCGNSTDTLDLARFVDVVVSSHDYGKPKKINISGLIRDQLDLDLGRCAFDDSEAAPAARNPRRGLWSASIP